MNRYDFTEYGRVYLPVNIMVMGGVSMIEILFKVDTGADTSTISKESLAILGYDIKWIEQNAISLKGKDKPTTATGDKISAGYVQLPLINILGYEGKNWPFQIIVGKNRDFRNLLGRDLLTGFNFSFNNDEDFFAIERAKTFKPRYPFLEKQEINDVTICM